MKLIKATLVGGMVLFFWYVASWTVFTWHQKTFESLPFGDEIIQTVLEGNQSLHPDSLDQRIYLAPKVIDPNNKEESYDKTAFAFIAISPNGLKPLANQIIFSFATQTLLAFIMSLILLLVNSDKFSKSYSIVVLISSMFAIGSALPNNNWWGIAPDFLLVDSIDLLIAWALAGIPIAFFTKNS